MCVRTDRVRRRRVTLAFALRITLHSGPIQTYTRDAISTLTRRTRHGTHHQDELLALGLLVVRVRDAHVRVGSLAIVQVLLQLRQPPCPCLRNLQLVRAVRLYDFVSDARSRRRPQKTHLVVKQKPLRVRLVRTDVVVGCRAAQFIAVKPRGRSADLL